MYNEKRLNLLVNIGSVKPKFFVIRVTIISMISVLLIYISASLIGETIFPFYERLKVYFISAIAFNSVSEVNLLALRQISKSEKFRWNISIRVISIITISAILIFFWIKIIEIALSKDNVLQYGVTQMILIVGFLIIIIHLLLNIISNLTIEWLNNRKEIGELKEAKLLSDYNFLKDRLNPHFLFNNLSVLKSLIHYNPKKAEVFTQNFTNVYRYVLKSHEEKVVTLHEELKFLDSYVALHKERIGDGLIVNLQVEEADKQKKIPPLALQLLVENAIKHNIANRAQPLQIDIITDNKTVTVRNNLNKKDTTYSSYTGLKTLQTQYKLIANKEITITETGTYYSIQIPLL